MEDNILGFPGYHITREGKLYNKGHPVKTFFLNSTTYSKIKETEIKR